MHFTEYINKVEDILSEMTEEEKDKWIINIAKRKVEGYRQKFLDSLVENPQEITQEQLIEIDKFCEGISQGSLYFESATQEEYGLDYWDREYVTEYYDPFGIVEKLMACLEIVDIYMLSGEYKEAYSLIN